MKIEIEWKRGPNNGGEGTAGMHADGCGIWWDRELLLCVVNLTMGREIFVAVVHADGNQASLTYYDSGDDIGWTPDDISWWAKIETALPPEDGKEGA